MFVSNLKRPSFNCVYQSSISYINLKELFIEMEIKNSVYNLKVNGDSSSISVTCLTGASSAPTMDAFDDASFFQLGLGHSANAVCAEIGVTRLYAAQAAEVFVAGFLPFGNQIGVGDLLCNAVIVQFTTDGLATVEQIVNVTRFLMVNFEYWPQRFGDTFAFVRFSFSWNRMEMRNNFRKMRLSIGKFNQTHTRTRTYLHAFFARVLPTLAQSIPNHLADACDFYGLLAFS